MKISVVINTYNASAYLSRVLDTVKDFDEVVVCDMESTDDTRVIATKYGCKIVTFPKGNRTICEPARNFAIQSATNPWVLVVDADELIPKALREYLYEFAEDPKGYAGLLIPRKNYMLNRFLKASYPDYQLRFFKREGSDWPETIHSVPKVAGQVGKIPGSRKDLAMVHISASLHSSLRKLNLYSDNEVMRREGEKVTLGKIILSPAFRFFKTYIMKGAFRYGKVGLIQAQKHAIYKFMVLSKMYENECAKDFWNTHGLAEYNDPAADGTIADGVVPDEAIDEYLNRLNNKGDK